MRSNLSAGLLALAAATATAPAFAGDDADSTNGSPALQLADDPTGVLGIVNLNGPTRTDGPFFQSLGTNGRSCSSCHVAALRALFQLRALLRRQISHFVLVTPS
jgi:cytochrome c peroxidase